MLRRKKSILALAMAVSMSISGTGIGGAAISGSSTDYAAEVYAAEKSVAEDFSYNTEKSDADDISIVSENSDVAGEEYGATDSDPITIKVPAGAMVKGDKKTLKFSVAKSKIKKISSSNKKVLTVTSKGAITAKKAGKATVTVTAKDGRKAKVKITVFKKNADMVISKKVSGKKGLWHLKKGKVVKKTGFATDGTNWFYCKNGFVNKKVTGLFSGNVNGKKALWYVKKGSVATDFSGAYKDKKATWFVKDGVVNKKLCGTFVAGNYTYKVNKGKVTAKKKGKLDAFLGDEIAVKLDEIKVIEKEDIYITLTYVYPETGYVSGLLFIGDKEYNFGIITENNENRIEQFDFIKDYKLEFIRKKGESYVLKLSNRGNIMAPTPISGKASDSYETKGFEYIESDKLIIFMKKGVKYDGNLLVEFEKQMEAAEKTAGFKRNKVNAPYSAMEGTKLSIMGTDAFEGVDTDCKKFHIYINDQIHPQCMAGDDTYNYIILNSDELDVNLKNRDFFCSDFVHEYSHAIHLSYGASFNPIMNEGFASYNEVKTTSAITGKTTADEDFRDQFYQYLLPKGHLTDENVEKIFINGYPDGPDHDKTYRYGYLFITYLLETYGKDAFTNLFPEGRSMLKKQLEETGMGDLSGENTLKLLKKTYSEDIFKNFVKWFNAHPEYSYEPYVEE